VAGPLVLVGYGFVGLVRFALLCFIAIIVDYCSFHELSSTS
jgi:hypothetical protein